MDLLFYLFSSMTLLSGVMVIQARNPVHSVLFLILVFFNAAGLLVLLGLDFFAMIFLVVYVGAIAVLFLFVVMMLNIKTIEWHEFLFRYLPIGILLWFFLVFEIHWVINNTLVPSPEFSNVPVYINWIKELHYLTNIEVIGNIMYTVYALPFILASLVLLVAMVGAIVLTMYKRKSAYASKKQLIYKQVARNFENVLAFVV